MEAFIGTGALITGGASGIGAEAVKRLRSEGAKVVIIDLNPPMFEDSGCHFIPADVADPNAMEEAVRQAIAWFEASKVVFRYLVNNAGIAAVKETPELSIKAWQHVISVDLSSIFYACRLIVPIIKKNGGGAIVNTASISGLYGDYAFSVYNAAKGGVVNYTRSLALDHGKDGIRVNALCPGFIHTGLTESVENLQGLMEQWEASIPLKRTGKPEEMANVIRFLLSDEASYVTGAILVADGGLTAHTGQPDLGRYLSNPS